METRLPGKKAVILIFLALMLLSLTQCVEEESQAPATLHWTGTDPGTIPYRQRQLLAERGNLVRNPSFESGRVINVDSNTVSSNILGWKQIGENVHWISLMADSNLTPGQVHTGSYSIMIERGTVDPDTEEGIQSDFIRVIPGNYRLSFRIRLQNIIPGKSYLGRRMDRSIEIRLMYYDKNRLLLGSEAAEGEVDNRINRTVKSQSFADFWRIDSLPWTLVNGRTTNQYLTEGDIPDEAKYVKIYMGLRGTGKMWIDDVDFAYTRLNFSSLERMRSLLDSSVTSIEYLTPAPKMVQVLEPLNYHIEGTDSLPLPLIVIPRGAGRQTNAAAEILKSRLDDIFASHFGPDSMPGIRILNDLPDKLGGGLVFSIGGLPRGYIRAVFSEYGRIPVEQAYIIRPDTLPRSLIHLCGVTPAGDFYAAATAVQLLDGFIYHQASITDYPEIPGRAFLISPVSMASNRLDYRPLLKEMASLKMNRAYLDYYRSKNLWLKENDAYLEGLRNLGSESRETGMVSLAQVINPYAFLPEDLKMDSLGMETGNNWIHSDPASINRLEQMMQEGYDAGAGTVVISTAGHLPVSPEGYLLLYSEKDRETYINLQAAHLDLIRSAGDWARKQGSVLEFEAPWASNEQLLSSRGQAEQYFTDLSERLPDDLLLHWTGPASMSFSVNPVDYYRYRWLTKHKLVMVDNSMNMAGEILEDTIRLRQHPMKLLSLNIFDPFFLDITDPGPMNDLRMLVNSPVYSEIMRIRIATAADYMWNPEAYQPDRSLLKVLVSRFGRDAAIELINFSDSYFLCMASMIGLKASPDAARLLRQIHAQEELMDESLRVLQERLPGEEVLINELKSMKQNLEKVFESRLNAVTNQVLAGSEIM